MEMAPSCVKREHSSIGCVVVIFNSFIYQKPIAYELYHKSVFRKRTLVN